MASNFFFDVGTPLIAKGMSFANATSVDLANAIVPVFTAATAVSILFYGFAVIRGDTQNAFMTFVWKAVKVAIIIIVIQQYAQLQIVSLASSLQDSLVAIVNSGSSNVLQVADGAVLPLVGFVAGMLLYIISITTTNANASSILMILLVICFVVCGGGALALAIFYSLLAKVGLFIVLGLGPLFIAALAFAPTARFFENWLSSVLGLVLMSAVTSLALTFVTATQSAAIGYAFVNPIMAIVLLLVYGIVMLLFMMEIPSLVSTLTSGVNVMNAAVGFASAKVLYSNSVQEAFDPKRSAAGDGPNKAAAQGRGR